MPDKSSDENSIARDRLVRAFTMVSSDVVEGNHDVEMPATAATNGTRVVLVPMSEWKQCAQRAIRTFMQAFVFLIGGGTVYQILTGLGIPPATAENLPSTGSALWDAILYALVFAVVVFLWNAAEFILDIDVKAPRWRA